MGSYRFSVEEEEYLDICFGLAAVASNVGMVKFIEFAHGLASNLIYKCEIVVEECFFGVALEAQIAVAVPHESALIGREGSNLADCTEHIVDILRVEEESIYSFFDDIGVFISIAANHGQCTRHCLSHHIRIAFIEAWEAECICISIFLLDVGFRAVECHIVGNVEPIVFGFYLGIVIGVMKFVAIPIEMHVEGFLLGFLNHLKEVKDIFLASVSCHGDDAELAVAGLVGSGGEAVDIDEIDDGTHFWSKEWEIFADEVALTVGIGHDGIGKTIEIELQAVAASDAGVVVSLRHYEFCAHKRLGEAHCLVHRGEKGDDDIGAISPHIASGTPHARVLVPQFLHKLIVNAIVAQIWLIKLIFDVCNEPAGKTGFGEQCGEPADLPLRPTGAEIFSNQQYPLHNSFCL